MKNDALTKVSLFSFTCCRLRITWALAVFLTSVIGINVQAQGVPQGPPVELNPLPECRKACYEFRINQLGDSPYTTCGGGDGGGNPSQPHPPNVGCISQGCDATMTKCATEHHAIIYNTMQWHEEANKVFCSEESKGLASPFDSWHCVKYVPCSCVTVNYVKSCGQVPAFAHSLDVMTRWMIDPTRFCAEVGDDN